jgi:hypothetical protein
MEFKILLTTPYEYINILNDNIDINVILPTGEVYFGVFFSIANIQNLLEKSDSGYFNSEDMIIVKELTVPTIRYAVTNIINNGVIELVMSKIGYIKSVLPGISTYEEIKDFGCPLYGLK